jgi:hypothetical protein
MAGLSMTVPPRGRTGWLALDGGPIAGRRCGGVLPILAALSPRPLRLPALHSAPPSDRTPLTASLGRAADSAPELARNGWRAFLLHALLAHF